jgi:predicted nuclease of predicted toxin-antitoxin system
MNLSPSWVERLAGHGFDAVHWSTIGTATAPDVEILTFANEQHFVVITNDLDFSAILAAGVLAGPSVVQIRSQDLLSDGVVSIVARRSTRTGRTSSEARSCRSMRRARASECCLSAAPRICRSTRRPDCPHGRLRAP